MELIVRQLSKRYKDKVAVDEVCLQLTKGINGLLGANGAGKTTLMRMLCGTLTPTSGSISLDGVDVSSEDYRAVLGYLPQDFGYYPNFTGTDFLLYLAQALLNDPWLLVVDEPTAGLDPQERVRFRNLIMELGQDTIVLLSTHIVSDVEPIADHMLMMSNGNVIFDNPWNKERTDLEQLYLREVGGQI